MAALWYQHPKFITRRSSHALCLTHSLRSIRLTWIPLYRGQFHRNRRWNAGFWYSPFAPFFPFFFDRLSFYIGGYRDLAYLQLSFQESAYQLSQNVAPQNRYGRASLPVLSKYLCVAQFLRLSSTSIPELSRLSGGMSLLAPVVPNQRTLSAQEPLRVFLLRR